MNDNPPTRDVDVDTADQDTPGVVDHNTTAVLAILAANGWNPETR